MKTQSPATATTDALAGLLVPPAGMWSKFGYYSARYGWLHALCSYVGRRWFQFWLWVGPVVTRRYLWRWLALPGPHVLNLGGGSVFSNRWLTADVTPRADVFMNVMKPLPLPDTTVDMVYSEEVIEHINRQAGRQMVAECFRVLKPGGTLRLTTPSLNYFAKLALSNPAAVQQINDIFYCHGHQFIYSEESLRQVLSETGFANIRQSTYRDANSKYGSFDSHPARFAFAPPEWSQYWEAEKPLKLS
jgi:predicted SAM-dependent methyltransferase